MSFTKLYYHVVFATKDREPVLTPEIHVDLQKYVNAIVGEDGATLVISGGYFDHVHLLLYTPARNSLPDLVRDSKSNSSRWLSRTVGLANFEWQKGYGGFTVGRSEIDIISNYIAGQWEHHRTVPFADEFKKLLTEHNIDFKPEYLWE